jgi:hypothetical protein
MKNYILPFLIALVVGFASCSEEETCGGGIEESRLFEKDSLIFTLPLEEKIYNPEFCISVYFKSIDSDSRCPVDVVCVWAGEVMITLEVTVGTNTETISIKNTDPAKEIIVRGERFYVRLLDVHPYPGQTGTVKPFATIEIVRIPK